MAETVISVEGLKKHYPVEQDLLTQLLGNQRYVHAVDGIDFSIAEGEIFGLAGESGCGKTTTGRCIARLTDPTDGRILFGPDQEDITGYSGDSLQEYRRNVQVVFQDPYESINDRFRVSQWVKEPLIIHGIGDRNDRRERVIETLEQCGLKPPEEFLNQYPHELSGGQRQRVALARAMVIDPTVIVADEPTSMLDVSVRAGVLNVFKRLVEEENVTIMYISHDLSLLRYICDRIGIMYQGELMEIGKSDHVLRQPKHPYTQSLISAVPRVDPTKDRDRVRIPPDVEEHIGEIEGCPFKQRCQYSFDRCNETLEFYQASDDHKMACHLYAPDVNKPEPTNQTDDD